MTGHMTCAIPESFMNSGRGAERGRHRAETPMVYKSIDAVMEAQRDLVDVVHTLRQVVCVKG